jgi:hypothetical protein
MTAEEQRYSNWLFLRTKFAKQRYAARSQRGIKWDLNEDRMITRILDSGVCSLSGRPLVYEANYITTPSLDRIDSDLGYIDSNVQWVGASVNTAKGTLDNQDFIELCADIARHNGYTVVKQEIV